MNSRTIKLTILTSIGAIALTGCVTDPVTGERKISKAAIGGVGGALGGYLLGDLIGGKNSRTEEIVGAGIGASRIGIHSFRDRGIDSVLNGSNPTLGYANSAYKWNLAWALHAGLAYNVTPDFTIELAYRYIHLGDGKSGDIIAFDGTNTLNNPMHFKDITSHDIKLGVRWALADMGVSHWAPPLVSKY